MAKHVFVEGLAASFAAGYALGDHANFNGNGIGEIGLWDLSLATPDHISGASGQEVVLANNVFKPAQFQITQGTTSGFPHATGIIDKARVRSVTMQTNVAGAKAVTANVTIDNASALNSTAWGVKIIQRAGSSNYEDSINPQNDMVDRVGKIMSYEFVTDASGTVAEIAAGLTAAINADPHAIVTATNATGAQIKLEAKEYGTGFQVIDTSATALSFASGTLVGTYGCTEGYGNGWQAVQAEKKARHHKSAYHNRISFAKTGPELFANTAKSYDVITITCDGGVRQDATNAMDDQIIELWIPYEWTTASSSALASAFVGFAHGTATLQTIYTR